MFKGKLDTDPYTNPAVSAAAPPSSTFLSPAEVEFEAELPRDKEEKAVDAWHDYATQLPAQVAHKRATVTPPVLQLPAHLRAQLEEVLKYQVKHAAQLFEATAQSVVSTARERFLEKLNTIAADFNAKHERTERDSVAAQSRFAASDSVDNAVGRFRAPIDKRMKAIVDAEARNQSNGLSMNISAVDYHMMKNNLTPVSKKYYITNAAARPALRLPADLSGGAVRVSVPRRG